MAWRNVQLYYQHAARTAAIAVGDTAITSNATFTTPKGHLVDDRAGIRTALSSGANNYIQVDTGPASPPTVDHLFIPAGHNLNGCSIKLESDDNASFTTPTTMLGSTAITGSAAISLDVTSSAERYYRLTFITSGTWQISELFLTRKQTLSRGPDQGWEDGYVFPVEIYAKRTGARPAAEFGSKLRVLEFEFKRVGETDYAQFAALLNAVGTTRPFLLDVPFDTSGQIWCSLLAPLETNSDKPNEQATGERRYRVRMRVQEWAA